MAQRRMFSLTVTDSDLFQDMPLSTQALYFHLGMHADDDGFLGNAKRIVKLIGASEDDFKLLGVKGFILDMDAGIYVIRHWKMCNYIQKDRYRPTVYKAEKSRLFLLPDNTYSTVFQAGAKPLAPAVEPSEPVQIPADPLCIQPVSNVYPNCTRSIDKDSIGEVRLELGKDRLLNICCDGQAADAADIVRAYLQSRSLEPEQFLGTPDELLQEVRRITQAIFAAFGGRQATETDVALVLPHITDYTPDAESGVWTGRTIQNERAKLLLYAFEQAARVGQSGNWNYIEGVLRNLASRGITTLAQAEEYDDNR